MSYPPMPGMGGAAPSLPPNYGVAIENGLQQQSGECWMWFEASIEDNCCTPLWHLLTALGHVLLKEDYPLQELRTGGSSLV